MSENTKLWIASSIQTFAATFLSVVGMTLAEGDIVWTGAFWSGVLLVAVRAAIKAVLSKTTIPMLGGKK
jgi:hypothetical protein